MKSGSARWKLVTDVAIALVFTVFCLVVTAHIPPEEGERYNGWAVVTIIVVGAGLLLQRRRPYVALGIVIAGLATYTVANFAGGPVYLAPLVPLYTIAQRGDRRRTWTAVGATIALLLPFALISENPMLRQLETAENSERIELGRLKVAIEVHVSSYRSRRGRTP